MEPKIQPEPQDARTFYADTFSAFPAFFSLLLVPSVVAQAKGSPDTVDLTHTHLEIEALSQGGLKAWTCHARSLSAGGREKGSCLSAQFRWMAMSSILQSDFSLCTDSTK